MSGVSAGSKPRTLESVSGQYNAPNSMNLNAVDAQWRPLLGRSKSRSAQRDTYP